ncbi:ribosomal protein L7/L12 [Streptomyces sp. NPDC004376]
MTSYSPPPGPNPLAVAQTVRRLTALSLWRSKVLVTRPPSTILKEVPLEATESAATALRKAGARVEIRKH